MAEGRITRGTTGTNRLRRIDRWIAASTTLLRADDPMVVDLGYGANAWTAVELFERLRAIRPDVTVVGVEIDPERVQNAQAETRPGLSFVRGGFEVPLPGGRGATIIRALNVLRQYEESEVLPAWHRLCDRLEPGGILIDGTSNELGRVATWVELDAQGPRSLTISLRLADLESPSIAAERLPKILIHRNVPGERVHALISDLDRGWQHSAPLASFGRTQRWRATVTALGEWGWPIVGSPSRRRLGEVTVDWSSVEPVGFAW